MKKLLISIPYEEAIDMFRRAWHEIGVSDKNVNRAFTNAIDSMEKQIPKKPKLVNYLVYKKYVCGCENVVAVKCVIYLKGRHKQYCDRCGQAIDWGEE